MYVINDRKRKSDRAVAISQTTKVIRNARPGMPQTQVLSMASKQLSGKNKNSGILPLLELEIGALTGLIGAKMFCRGLVWQHREKQECI